MRLAALLVLSLSTACGSVPAQPVAKEPALVVTPPRVEPLGEVLPRLDEVKSLSLLVPATASAVIGLPAAGAAGGFLAGAPGELVLHLAAERAGIAPEAIRVVAESSAGCVLFRGSGDELGAVVRVRDGQVANKLARMLELDQTGPDSWRSTQAAAPIHLDRFAKAGVLVVTSGETLRASVLARAEGRGAPFVRRTTIGGDATGGTAIGGDASEIWAVVDLAAQRDNVDVMAPGSRLEMSLTNDGLTIDYVQNGKRVPRIARVIAPGAPAALGKLPGGALAGVGLSIRRPPGTSLQDVLVELDRPTNGALSIVVAQLVLDYAHRSLAELDRALGDEVALGVYAPDGAVDALDALTLVATIDTRSDLVARSLVAAYERAERRSSHKRDDRTGVEVVAEKGRVLIVMGPKQSAAKLLREARKPTRTLAATAPGAVPAGAVHAHGFADLDAITSLLPAGDRPALAPPGSPTIRSGTLSFRESGEGIDAVFRSVDRDDTDRGIRVLAAFATQGVRGYIASTKVAEAKNAVGAIARSAVAAYEREQMSPLGAPASSSAVVHALCDSASPVPAAVPKGSMHQPSAAPGADFQSGTPTAGWRCLRFEMSLPHYYQYEYRRGGPYKGPARGGPDPGPDGFEVSAEGDLDGDGQTSLFTAIGRIDRPGAAVRLSTQLFVSDERE